jgi:transcriptional antiterminator RfaH
MVQPGRISEVNYVAISDKPLWYAVYTKPKEEERADSNLRAWGVKTFTPKIRERRRGRGYHNMTNVIKHLFPRYIFAQFISNADLHKVNYTRGVCNVVGFGEKPCPVDDVIIDTIQSQIGEEGFIRFGEDIHKGEKVMIQDGPFESFNGTVEREMRDSDRLVVLLSSVSYQGRLIIEKALVKKMAPNN